MAYFYRGLGFSAKYFRMDQQMHPAATGAPSKLTVDVPFEGYYVQATYLLTGEQRTTYSVAVDPLRPFDPTRGAGLGAWEAVGRVSRLRVGDVVFAPGNARLADPLAVSDEATEMTLGFNWYLNKWVRTQFNWEHAWFGQPVRTRPRPARALPAARHAASPSPVHLLTTRGILPQPGLTNMNAGILSYIGTAPCHLRRRRAQSANLPEFAMKTKAEIVRDWLPRYTGRPLEEFGKYILLSNFVDYVELFAARFGVEVLGRDRPDAVGDGRGHHDPQLRHGQRDGRDRDGPALGHRRRRRCSSWASAAA